jgi:hypothetical protein
MSKTLINPLMVAKILSAEGPYASCEEKCLCQSLVENKLTSDEQELAAQSSYVYWYACVHCLFDIKNENTVESTCDEKKNHLNDENRDSQANGHAPLSRKRAQLQMAMREARRHLVANAGNVEIAINALRKACLFRKVSTNVSTHQLPMAIIQA